MQRFRFLPAQEEMAGTYLLPIDTPLICLEHNIAISSNMHAVALNFLHTRIIALVVVCANNLLHLLRFELEISKEITRMLALDYLPPVILLDHIKSTVTTTDWR